jgi:hypothetical protein
MLNKGIYNNNNNKKKDPYSLHTKFFRPLENAALLPAILS